MSDVLATLRGDDIPFAAGVPSLLNGTNDTPGPDALTADGPAVDNARSPQWGIFTTDGAPVIIPDSVISFEYQNDYRISDFPIEEGGFASYNKVALPYDARVTFSRGGSDDERAKFLVDLDRVVDSTDLYTILTPEVIYQRANIVSYDYARRSYAGAKLLLVQVKLEEVRSAAAATFTKTRTASAAPKVNNGPVQPKKPTAGQTPPAPQSRGDRLNAIEDSAKVGPQ